MTVAGQQADSVPVSENSARFSRCPVCGGPFVAGRRGPIAPTCHETACRERRESAMRTRQAAAAAARAGCDALAAELEQIAEQLVPTLRAQREAVAR